MFRVIFSVGVFVNSQNTSSSVCLAGNLGCVSRLRLSVKLGASQEYIADLYTTKDDISDHSRNVMDIEILSSAASSLSLDTLETFMCDSGSLPDQKPSRRF